MKKILLLLLISVLFSCGKVDKIVVYHCKEAKIAVVDSIVIEFQSKASDAAILMEVKKILNDMSRAEFIADSLEFRRITKLINGGYNGFDDRWKIYLRAKEVLEEPQPVKRVTVKIE